MVRKGFHISERRALRPFVRTCGAETVNLSVRVGQGAEVGPVYILGISEMQ